MTGRLLQQRQQVLADRLGVLLAASFEEGGHPGGDGDRAAVGEKGGGVLVGEERTVIGQREQVGVHLRRIERPGHQQGAVHLGEHRACHHTRVKQVGRHARGIPGASEDQRQPRVISEAMHQFEQFGQPRGRGVLLLGLVRIEFNFHGE